MPRSPLPAPRPRSRASFPAPCSLLQALFRFHQARVVSGVLAVLKDIEEGRGFATPCYEALRGLMSVKQGIHPFIVRKAIDPRQDSLLSHFQEIDEVRVEEHGELPVVDPRF